MSHPDPRHTSTQVVQPRAQPIRTLIRSTRSHLGRSHIPGGRRPAFEQLFLNCGVCGPQHPIALRHLDPITE